MPFSPVACDGLAGFSRHVKERSFWCGMATRIPGAPGRCLSVCIHPHACCTGNGCVIPGMPHPLTHATPILKQPLSVPRRRIGVAHDDSADSSCSKNHMMQLALLIHEEI